METIYSGFESFSPYKSKCVECKHFNNTNFNCVAFPEVIPDRFLSGDAVHDSVVEGQQGKIIVTPVS